MCWYKIRGHGTDHSWAWNGLASVDEFFPNKWRMAAPVFEIHGFAPCVYQQQKRIPFDRLSRVIAVADLFPRHTHAEAAGVARAPVGFGHFLSGRSHPDDILDL